MGRIGRKNGSGDGRLARHWPSRSRWNWPREGREGRNQLSPTTKPRPRRWPMRCQGSAANADPGKANIGRRGRSAGDGRRRSPRSSAHLDILVNNAGHHPRSVAAQNDRRTMGRSHPDESQRLLLLHVGGDPDHVRAEVRPDRQYQFDERSGPGHRPGQLQCQQGRHHRLYEDRGARIGAIRDYRQRRLARFHRDRHVAGRARRDSGADQGRDSRWADLPSRKRSPKR